MGMKIAPRIAKKMVWCNVYKAQWSAQRDCTFSVHMMMNLIMMLVFGRAAPLWVSVSSTVKGRVEPAFAHSLKYK